MEIEKQQQASSSSSSDWMIMIVIILTILVFIYILMSTIKPPVAKQIDIDIEVQEDVVVEKFDGSQFVLTRDDMPIPSQEYVSMASQWMRAAFSAGYSLEKPIQLGEQEVSTIEVAKNFFIYDCRIVYDPSKRCFVVTILMELPPIQIFINDAYSVQYPLLNPYIHVVEFIYHWKTTSETMSDKLELDTFKVFTVGWEMNRYHRNFLDVTSLFRKPLPEPIEFTKEQLHQFLQDTGLFQTIPVLSDTPFTLSPIATNTEKTMTTKIPSVVVA
jgi:hypothetical protein